MAHLRRNTQFYLARALDAERAKPDTDWRLIQEIAEWIGDLDRKDAERDREASGEQPPLAKPMVGKDGQRLTADAEPWVPDPATRDTRRYDPRNNEE